MKRIIFIAVALTMSICATAQEAFKHLSAGLEVNTFGVGINFAFPVVTDHLVLTAGYDLLPLSISRNSNFSTSELTDKVNSANSQINSLNSKLSAYGKTERLSPLSCNVAPQETMNLGAKLGLSNAKVMLEYYPFAQSGFHIVAGAYIGSASLASLYGFSSSSIWEEFKSLDRDFITLNNEVTAIKNKYSSIEEIGNLDVSQLTSGSLREMLVVNASGNSYQIIEKSGRGYLGLDVKVAAVKPYLGIGFGRSIPDTRIGFQFDLGAAYVGNISMGSLECETAYNPEGLELSPVTKINTFINKIKIYPNISFRLICNIF